MGRIRKPITISDWVQFLSQKHNTYSTIIVALISLIVALFALMFVSYNIRLSLSSISVELSKMNVSESTYKILRDNANALMEGEQYYF
jgi:hypothetical protein